MSCFPPVGRASPSDAGARIRPTASGRFAFPDFCCEVIDDLPLVGGQTNPSPERLGVH